MHKFLLASAASAPKLNKSCYLRFLSKRERSLQKS